MTLYTFDKDDKGKSNCYDQCAKNWPPFAAAGDAKADGDWTIIDRSDGTRMWAYGGKPLYTFANDSKPGDVTGDMVGGVWHVAKPLPVKT
jgi:predicted lipoprotein with Yx(FWY)xxD motif